MRTVRTLIALSVALLAAACAGTATNPDATPSAQGAPMAMATTGSMPAMDARMKAMQAMHQKMLRAGTPAERQALMAEHMAAMQGGMAMMKEMHTMHAMHTGSGAGGMGMMGAPAGAAPMAGMGEGKGKGMPADMAQRHQMMADHMALMQTMMDMMSDRMPSAPATK